MTDCKSSITQVTAIASFPLQMGECACLYGRILPAHIVVKQSTKQFEGDHTQLCPPVQFTDLLKLLSEGFPFVNG